jgi:hypothetical protein
MIRQLTVGFTECDITSNLSEMRFTKILQVFASIINKKTGPFLTLSIDKRLKYRTAQLWFNHF